MGGLEKGDVSDMKEEEEQQDTADTLSHTTPSLTVKYHLLRAFHEHFTMGCEKTRCLYRAGFLRYIKTRG